MSPRRAGRHRRVECQPDHECRPVPQHFVQSHAASRRGLTQALGAMAKHLALLAAFLLASAPPAAVAAPGPEQLVRSLYRDFSWETVMVPPAGYTTLGDQPPRTLGRYFTPAVAKALHADSRCASRNHDICALELSPIWDVQVPGAHDLEVAAEAGVGVVTVRYRIPGTGQAVSLRYQLVRLRSGWRIRDISYSSGESLRSRLGLPE